MKQIWEVDNDGNIIETHLMTDAQIERALLDCRHIVDFPWGTPFVKPVFSFELDKWIEGATTKEIQEIQDNQPKPEPSISELMEQQRLIKQALDELILGGMGL